MNALIVVAGGSGQRLGASVPKALVELAGRTLIDHCVRTALEWGKATQIVVVAPATHMLTIRSELPEAVEVVAGGSTRDASVRKGLAALAPGVGWVLVHDAARPLAPVQVYDRVLQALESGAQAVVPGLPVADTIKAVVDGYVARTVPRDDLVAIQTPQGFELEALIQAHARQTGEVTDDAQLLEQSDVPVRVVEGSPLGLKVTTKFDLAVAQALAKEL